MRSAALLLFVSVSLQAQGPSGDRLKILMDVPFASALSASPTGARIAWIEDDRGARNILVAQAPDWKPRAATRFTGDDGQEIADIAWSHDSNTIYFARGGDFENGGDNPNPGLQLQRPDQSIWSVPFASGVARKLTEGHAAAPSPKGDTVAFLRDRNIYMMKADGADPVIAFSAKGNITKLRWSPDARYLAFTDVRGDHSFIGVYSVADRILSFPDASSGFDSHPAWSADGTHLAYVRVPAQPREFAPRRFAIPWSIRVFDPQSKSAREMFHAAPGPGSAFREIASEPQLFWSRDRVVFPWEKTGFLHLYSVAASAGSSAHELTPGQGEVEHVSLAHNGQTLFYSSNIAVPDSLDVDRRHISKVDVDGLGVPVPVTRGDGIEWSPTPLADGSDLAVLASTYNQRAHAEMVHPNGSRSSLIAAPEAFAAAGKLAVKPQQAIIPAADGLPIHGQLYLPPTGDKAGEHHPALIFVHGGSRRQMLLGYHYMYYYSNAYSMNQYLASLGYLVLSINYRSGIGYGLDFREAINYGLYGGSEYQDVVGAGLYLKSRPDVDGRRIGIWGGSYGGYLTALALARASSLFAAGVDFHGVHDWSTIRTFEAKGGDPAEIERVRQAARTAFDSSPMAAVDTWRSPVLLIHGDDDRNVAFSQTVELAAALRKRNVSVEEIIFPNEIHDFLLQRHWMEAYQAAAAFFEKHLQAAASLASTN